MPFFLLCVGLILIYLEFYTPGGILAVIGGIFLLSSIIVFALGAESSVSIVAFIALVIASLAFDIWVAIESIKRSSQKNTFLLSKDQEGYQGAQFDSSMIGKVATAFTDLRPSGFVTIEGKRFAASCRDSYIEKGSQVFVIGGEGAQLFVKPKGTL